MKRVAVIRGGPSDEYHVSMKTGQAVLAALNDISYPVRDITITKKGEWLENGFVRHPELSLEGVDVVFLALHGHYGEDGQIQRMLERKRIPFTGSRSFASAVAFNKELTKRTLRPHAINLPRHRLVTRFELEGLVEDVPHIFNELGGDLFVKPVASGSSLDTMHVNDGDRLVEILNNLLTKHEQIMIEECIKGREATVGVISDFRGEKTYVLPAIEIVPPNGEFFFNHEHKYSGQTSEIVPGRFSYQEKTKLAEAAALVHEIIDCSHYSRSDFIVRDGEVYFLEVNTLPGLTSESLFPKAADAVGLSFNELVRHLVHTAKF
jgi:D-alanine-D-alanine ligase